MLPAAPAATSPGYHKGPCGRCQAAGWGRRLGTCSRSCHDAQDCPRPRPSWQAAGAPVSYLKGRSAVEFTPAKDWLLLILVMRTRRCGRTDSDIVECDLEGLPGGHERAGSPAARGGNTGRQGCHPDRGGSGTHGPGRLWHLWAGSLPSLSGQGCSRWHQGCRSCAAPRDGAGAPPAPDTVSAQWGQTDGCVSAWPAQEGADAQCLLWPFPDTSVTSPPLCPSPATSSRAPLVPCPAVACAAPPQGQEGRGAGPSCPALRRLCARFRSFQQPGGKPMGNKVLWKVPGFARSSALGKERPSHSLTDPGKSVRAARVQPHGCHSPALCYGQRQRLCQEPQECCLSP